jgi:hypothetical protein
MSKKVCKSYPHACPVCKGRGELTEELAQHEGIVKYDLGDHEIYSCHVCQGQCIIWEYREEDAPEEALSPPLQLPPGMQPYIPPIQIGKPTIGDGTIDPYWKPDLPWTSEGIKTWNNVKN